MLLLDEIAAKEPAKPIAPRPAQPTTATHPARIDWNAEINRRIDLVESQGLVADVEEIITNLQAELGHSRLDRTLAQHFRHRAA